MMRRTPSSFHLPLPSSAPAREEVDIGSASFLQTSGDVAHALFAPLHYERNYPYPLLVWLHGPGDDERQLTRIMPLVSMRNYVGVAPRGTWVTSAEGRGIYGWQQSEEEIRQAEQRVFDSIETAGQKFHIADRRVFIAGFDAGGTMAFRIALRQPSRFAGALSLCGPFPTGQTPLDRLVEARRLPLFLAVGRYSQEYPSAEVCENLRLLHSAGMSLTLRQYPSGHELSQQMLDDVNRWVIDQITPPPTPAAESDHQWSREAD